MMTKHDFIQRIEGYLEATGMPATKFGKLALRDPHFVHDIRKGRECREKTRDRALHYIDTNPPNPEGADNAA